MNKLNYTGMPNIDGKTPEEAISLLFQHCQDVAENMVSMSRKLDDLTTELTRVRDQYDKLQHAQVRSEPTI